MSDAYTQYKETQILTASPAKLLLMLYDGAINAMESALAIMSDKTKYDKVNTHLIKAQDIIGELMSSINFDIKGELPQSLQSLYAYMLKKLMEGNFRKQKEPIQEVLKFMKDLRETWGIAAQQTGNLAPNTNNSQQVSSLNISG